MSLVRAENLTKVFRMYKKPVDRLKEAIFRRPFHEKFVALEDVTFQVSQGEPLGIIGDNGAGKSTLLKILANTLEPSSGKLKVEGKVSALLELGAGFHSEFTGRQNIFLNASLQGLSEKNIQDKEKEIIDFAELDQFIDRPVKTYSSGMIVRLAFSIATCVDPDILLIDEALSVGDYSFQQKCVQRMMKFIESGKTVILCSHSMYLINKLSTKTIWLEHGRVRAYEDSAKVISDYLSYQEEIKVVKQEDENNFSEESKQMQGKENVPEAVITEIRLKDKNYQDVQFIQQVEDLIVQISTKQITDAVEGHMVLLLKNEQEIAFFGSLSKDYLENPISFEGEKTVEIYISSCPLQSGNYSLHAIITDEYALRIIHEHATDYYKVISKHPEYGLLHIDHLWRIPEQVKV